MKWLFWVGLAAALYTVVGYPLWVALKGILFPKRVRRANFTPYVSVVVPAHNEEAHIGERIEDLLAADYPEDRLEIIVVSDGSTDGTCEVVRKYEPRVRLLELKEQLGKTEAQNIAAREAQGQILLFTDATTRFAPNAIRLIMRNFADEDVGCVTGQVVFKSIAGTAAESGMGWYARYQRFLRRAQSLAGSLLAATGCIYAFRQELFAPVPAGLVNDLVIPLMVIEKGKRVVYEEEALAYVERPTYTRHQFARHTRIILQGLRAMWYYRHLLNPFRCKYAFGLLSSKVARWFLPYFLALAFFANIPLIGESPLYRWVFLLQCAFYGMAVFGALTDRLTLPAKRVLALPFTFCLMNAAAVAALFKLARGERGVRWSTKR